MTNQLIKDRLEYLREEILMERISYEEITELQSLKEYIDKGDTLLLEWADDCDCAECNDIPF